MEQVMPLPILSEPIKNCFEPKIASRLRNVQTLSLKIFDKLPSQTILQNPQNVFYCHIVSTNKLIN